MLWEREDITLGELAGWLRDDIRSRTGLEVKLKVISMQGYKRDMRFEHRVTAMTWDEDAARCVARARSFSVNGQDFSLNALSRHLVRAGRVAAGKRSPVPSAARWVYW